MIVNRDKNIGLCMPDLRGGSETAFDRVFSHFYPSLCFFANRFINDKDTAEDIVQETMLKLWEKRQDFEAIEAVKAFLYVSVRNACFNILDKQKVKQKHLDTIATSELISNENILHLLLRTELISQISEAVDTLPEQCRKIIRMTYEEELKPKYIAEQLGISISTVNNQKMRGLSLLRDRLSDQDFSIALLLLVSSFIR